MFGFHIVTTSNQILIRNKEIVFLNSKIFHLIKRKDKLLLFELSF